MSSINKAIIPAAGLGKRMQPLSSYLPKPMLPLGEKPVLEYIIKEIRASGISETLIVTRSDHRAISEYFGDDEDIKICIDDSAGGPGRAVLEGESFASGESFLVVFSDAPLRGENPAQVIRGMIKVFEKYSAESVLSIYPISKEEANSRGIVKVKKRGKDSSVEPFRIMEIREKPDNLSVHNPWASACRYIFTENIFDALKAAEADENGELQLTAGINVLLEKGYEALGVPLPDQIDRHDTGNFKGYFSALEKFIQ